MHLRRLAKRWHRSSSVTARVATASRTGGLDQVTVFRQRLEQAIGKLPHNSPEARLALYGKVRAFVAMSRFAPHASALEQAIAEVERAHAARQPPAPLPPTGRMRAAVRAPWLAAAAGLLAVGGLGWYVLVGPAVADNPEFDDGVAGYSDNARSTVAIASWSTYYIPREDGGQHYLEGVGPVPLIAIRSVEIDPGRRYEVSARVRTVRDDPSVGGARTFIGVATYDAEGELEETPPGPHRFPAADNLVIASAQGWVELKGVITGTGNERADQFRPGTRSVRLVALLNNASPQAISQIDYLRLRELPPGE